MEQMKPHIVIAGGSGMIGTACRMLFVREGYDVYVLTRRKDTGPGEVSWSPETQWIEKNIIEGAAAVVNLCGLSLAERRWTSRYKALLHSSRIIPAQFLKKLIAQAVMPPGSYIGASGIGIYGDQGASPVYDDSEMSVPGFVADLVRSWEKAHQDIDQIRNVILRIGVVLSAEGGFMGKLIPPARFGLYPYFGSGRQLLSWIQIDDLTQMVLHCVGTNTIAGVYHATSPNCVAQCDLMKTLKEVQGHPGIVFSVPELFLRLGLGEMAALLFESTDVRPDKIMRAGFQFEYGDIRTALQHTLRPQVT